MFVGNFFPLGTGSGLRIQSGYGSVFTTLGNNHNFVPNITDHFRITILLDIHDTDLQSLHSYRYLSNTEWKLFFLRIKIELIKTADPDQRKIWGLIVIITFVFFSNIYLLYCTIWKKDMAVIWTAFHAIVVAAASISCKVSKRPAKCLMCLGNQSTGMLLARWVLPPCTPFCFLSVR
jgi:hypothetical protein